MRSKEYLWNICMQVYRQMYKEADPPADFDQLIESGEAAKPDWFMNYYLPEERQIDIVADICAEHHCSRYERQKISAEVFLGSAPTSVKK